MRAADGITYNFRRLPRASEGTGDECIFFNSRDLTVQRRAHETCLFLASFRELGILVSLQAAFAVPDSL